MKHIRYTTTPYSGTKHRLRGVYLQCIGDCPTQDGVSFYSISDWGYAKIKDGLFDIAEKMWVWNSSTDKLEQDDNPEWPYPEDDE